MSGPRRPQSPPGRGKPPSATPPRDTKAAPPVGRTTARPQEPAPQAGSWARVDSSSQSQPRKSAVAVAERSAIDVAIDRARARVTDSPLLRRDERERERRGAKRRLWLKVWGRRIGIVVVALALVWVALLSPFFQLDPAKVEVSGYGTVVDPTAVRAAIDEFEGTALGILNTGRVSHELKDILGVREAHVQRAWPDGLVVTIESREPVAAVPDPSGGYTYVDDDGVQVGRTAKKPKGLPILAIPLGEDNQRVLASALGVLAAMPDDLRERVTQLNASTEDSVSFKLNKGPTVEWGSADQSELKVAVLQVLLESKQARKADVIDVSAPTLPITKN